MKRFLLFLGVATLSISLIGCGTSTSVEAGLPDSFKVIARDKIGKAVVYTIQNIETKCFYLSASTAYNNAGEGGITQMFVEKNGVSVPYCEG